MTREEILTDLHNLRGHIRQGDYVDSNSSSRRIIEKVLDGAINFIETSNL